MLFFSPCSSHPEMGPRGETAGVDRGRETEPKYDFDAALFLFTQDIIQAGSVFDRGFRAVFTEDRYVTRLVEIHASSRTYALETSLL